MIHSLIHHRIGPHGLAKATLHYNPTIVRIGSKTFIIYRCQNGLKSRSWLSVSEIGLKGRIVWTKRLATAYHTAEDPRAAVLDGVVYVFYQTGASHWPKIAPDDWTVRVARFDLAFNPLGETSLKWEGRGQTEKNWCPFWYPPRKKWYCLYRANPPLFIEFDENWQGSRVPPSADAPPPWAWGEIRGGACPQLVMPATNRFGFGLAEPLYFSWFHSRYDPPKCTGYPPQYVGGLMSFSAEYPFRMMGISSRPILWPDPKNRSVVDAHVAYPGGAFLEDDRWTVSYGHGDCECRIANVLHDELLDGRNWTRLA